MENKKRCQWCQNTVLTLKYHDNEWGIPVHDDKIHFEFLTLEVMQCGLNWTMILKKRDILRQCFENFDFYKIALYDEKDIERIMKTEGMIKSERKIKAVINNAKLYIDIIKEHESFDKYLWNYSQFKTLIYINHKSSITTQNYLSNIISKDLKKRGFKYLGSITIYAHLQACGIINDHEPDCFMYDYINNNFPINFVK
ncbi:MAG: DNA-3-methyladenine glycosylase I [Eisenbergiella sp.]